MRNRPFTRTVWAFIIAAGMLLSLPGGAAAQITATEIKASLDQGEALQKKGEFQAALENFRQNVALARTLGDERLLSVALQLLGGVQRLRGEYVDSEASYREALLHGEKAGDFQRQSWVLNNLANLFGAQSRYTETIAMLRQCIAINEREGFNDDASPWQNLAITYALQGDHARSLEYFQKALKIYERLNATSKLALLHYNLGVLQMKQGNYPAAKREYQEAQQLAEKSGDQIVAAQAMGDLGRVQELEGHSAEALASMQRGLALCKQFGHKACVGESEVNVGNFYLAHGKPAEAEAAFDRARQTFEPLKDSYNLGQALRGLGYVSRQGSNRASGVEYARQALAIAVKIGDPDGQWQSHALLGLLARDSGDGAAARTSFAAAIAVIEQQRGKVGGGEAEKQRFFEKAVYPYQQLALLEAEEHRPFAALRASESARSRVLLDMLAGGPEKISGSMSDTERTDETKLLAAVAGLNARMGRAGAAEKEGLRTRYEEAWAGMKRSAPRCMSAVRNCEPGEGKRL